VEKPLNSLVELAIWPLLTFGEEVLHQKHLLQEFAESLAGFDAKIFI
jgi:hypothetical protein